jgi:hypothetical protein
VGSFYDHCLDVIFSDASRYARDDVAAIFLTHSALTRSKRQEYASASRCLPVESLVAVCIGTASATVRFERMRVGAIAGFAV